MKQKIAKYMLFIYLSFIKEDWDVIKPIGRFFLKPAWFVNSIFVWIMSILLLPLLYPVMIYKERIKEI